ncbi:unnamed protein product [Thelazia callipaeda]|uniref:BHLH domain-containing protein n=1 Tax=Thelazia callipaeda TaxID=103827 RepID=A0A158RBK2_THECL|nr:unnamed protein product [Thelazia callipaeda]
MSEYFCNANNDSHENYPSHVAEDYFSKCRRLRSRRQKKQTLHFYELRRKAANERERKRMNSINEAFDRLRHLLPLLPRDRKLSKVSTLREAIRYIKQLNLLINDGNAASTGELPLHSLIAVNSEVERPPLLVPNSDANLPVKYIELSCHNQRIDEFNSTMKTESGAMQGKCSKVWVPSIPETNRSARDFDPSYQSINQLFS